MYSQAFSHVENENTSINFNSCFRTSDGFRMIVTGSHLNLKENKIIEGKLT